MSTRTTGYLDAIEHMPDGATLVIHQVSWDDYERLVEDVAQSDRHNVRISYDRGRLEIMSPLSKHEKYGRFIDSLVRVLSEELDLNVESFGSTTWKRRKLAKGAEPDACYYVASAGRIIGKRTIDQETDPPPDIVVEIDITNESLSKFSIYAALGIPEIWRYDEQRFQIYELSGDRYVEAPSSHFFAELTGSMLAESLELSESQGQTEALKAFRQQIRARNLGNPR